MSINSTSTINLKNRATLIKGLIIIITALIAAYILNDIINGVELRRIAKINLIKIKSKIEEETPQKMGNNGKGKGELEGTVENKDEEKDKIEVKNEVRSEESNEKIKKEKQNEAKITITPTNPKITISNQLTKTINNNDTQLIQIAQLWRVKPDNLTLCPEFPPNLKGKIDVDMRSLKLEEIEEEYKDLWPGGHWRPKECKSRQKVAIVVPYRNREPHLRTFLHNIHRFLQKQQLDYAIFVVEQTGDFAFNKGRLTNIGVLEVTFFL
ncbi:unnamed protein product [Meloidogyne enterolobii]|uniref:Uncharacterized protein n=1 Tax=Meloidogyne enterolobii TaxID=390850 RepID=A0ACB0YAD1_MELEN